MWAAFAYQQRAFGKKNSQSFSFKKIHHQFAKRCRQRASSFHSNWVCVYENAPGRSQVGARGVFSLLSAATRAMQLLHISAARRALLESFFTNERFLVWLSSIGAGALWPIIAPLAALPATAAADTETHMTIISIGSNCVCWRKKEREWVKSSPRKLTKVKMLRRRRIQKWHYCFPVVKSFCSRKAAQRKKSKWCAAQEERKKQQGRDVASSRASPRSPPFYCELFTCAAKTAAERVIATPALRQLTHLVFELP